MKFNEYEGMILLESPATTAKNIQRVKENGKWISHWQYERGANHTHTDMSAADREHILQELEIADEFASALRETYPDRKFVVTHIPCYAVSFYQAEDDAPTHGIFPIKNSKSAGDTVWCQTCQCQRSYRVLPAPDADFPQVEWGLCEVCQNDVIISADCKILTFIESRGG